MNLKNIIAESINDNPIGIKEAIEKELLSRIANKLKLEDGENPLLFAAYEKNKSVLKNPNRTPV